MVRSKGNAVKNNNVDRTNELQSSRKRYKHRQGFMVLREIKRLQKTTNLLIPKASFSRLVREVLHGFGRLAQGFRVSADCFEALHEAAEVYMVQFFEDSYLCTLHARRVTLMVKDMQLCRRLRGVGDVINA